MLAHDLRVSLRALRRNPLFVTVAVLTLGIGIGLGATASAVFVYECVAKLISVYPSRRIGVSATYNPWLHASIAAGVLLTLLFVFVPPLRSIIALEPLGLAELSCVAVALLVTQAASDMVAHAARSAPAQRLRPRSA